MKLISNINDIVLVDDEPIVGALVKSQKDENSTGMIVQLLNNNEVMVLWNTPPKHLHKKFGNIW